jgi:tetratricopeptide (TPR) repeat protein
VTPPARPTSHPQARSSGAPQPGGWSVREAAELVGLPPARLRAWVRAGLLAPERGARGAPRLSFRDLAFLRRVRDLGAARIAPRRLRQALEQLRARLPAGSDLAEVPLAAAAGQLVVREGDALWSPGSGQCVFDFEAAAARRAVVALPSGCGPGGRALSAAEWYGLGCELEGHDTARALAAFRRALALDPLLADAHLDLGCLLHERGELSLAEAHYRAAAAARPGDATALFDLAVVLEDQGRLAEARARYGEALAADPACADAHFNLARLCEREGDAGGVVRHLIAYRRLARPD